jgi:transaldolase
LHRRGGRAQRARAWRRSAALDPPDSAPYKALGEEASMKIFIDSGDLAEIRDAAAMGVVDGVTTNPSLVAKAGRPLAALIKEICEIVDGPVSAEVIGTDCASILKEGRELAKLHKNVVVKVPLIAEGIKAVKVFSQEGIKTNVTLCFSASQGLLAAKAGATYISPFIGRIDDLSGDGMTLIRQLVQIYDNYGFETQVLAASVRHPVHVVECALAAAHVATLPHKVIHQLLQHPLTASGLATFLADAKKIPTT